MASDKQTMDLHTRRMVISVNPIKGQSNFTVGTKQMKKPPEGGI
jgi:hypothetical protein